MTDNEQKEICVICLDEKRSPVGLQCGHTFCTACFTHYKTYQKYAWASRCPICRRTIKEKTRSVKRKAADNLEERDARATVQPRLLSPPTTSSSTSTNVHQTTRPWAGHDRVLEEFLSLAVENDVEQGQQRLGNPLDYMDNIFRERDTSDANNSTTNATSQQQEERNANENDNEVSESEEDSPNESQEEFMSNSDGDEIEFQNIYYGPRDSNSDSDSDSDSTSDSERSDHGYHFYNDYEGNTIEIDSLYSTDSNNRDDALTVNVENTSFLVINQDTEDELNNTFTEHYIDLTNVVISSSEQQQQREQQPQEQQEQQQQQQQQQEEDQHDTASETDVIMTSSVIIRDVIIID